MNYLEIKYWGKKKKSIKIYAVIFTFIYLTKSHCHQLCQALGYKDANTIHDLSELLVKGLRHLQTVPLQGVSGLREWKRRKRNLETLEQELEDYVGILCLGKEWHSRQRGMRNLGYLVNGKLFSGNKEVYWLQFFHFNKYDFI